MHARTLVFIAIASVCAPACTATSESGADCQNGDDDDGDGLADCDDPSCALSVACNACGNGQLDPGEACDDGNALDGDACSSRCFKSACGNGKLDVDEQCDDGNLVPADGCSSRCEFDFCGDRVLQVAVEACEDGNRDDGDGCSSRCQAEPSTTCGDGVAAFDKDFVPLELCDDGNRQSGDGCSANCRPEFCGDGIVEPSFGEQCDDADPRAPPQCVGCVIPRCGDFIFSPGEQCDDGNTANNDGCSSLCRSEFCGDGVVQNALGESCDDGNQVQTDRCVFCAVAAGG